MLDNTMSIQRCDFCGAVGVRLVSVVKEQSVPLYFCNFICKMKYIDKVREGVSVENEKSCCVPEMRVLRAVKSEDGSVTVVCG